MHQIASPSLRDDYQRSQSVTNAPAAKAKSRATSRFDVSFLTDVQEIRDFAPIWQSVLNASSGVDFFQSREWCLEYIRHCEHESDFSPFVVVARRDGVVVALLPLSVQKKNGLTIATGLTEPFQQYTELLIVPGTDGSAVLEEFAAKIRHCGFDLVHLGQVRDGSNLQLAMGKQFAAAGEHDAAPSVPLVQWENFDEYFKSVKPKTRKNMRNARNKLEKQGSLSHHVHRDGAEFSGLVHRTFKMRKQWLKETGVTSRAFRENQFERFVDHIAELGESGKTDLKLIGMSLRLDNHPIAEQWGFVHKNRYYAFISGWDMEYDFASPGKLHLGEVIKACYDERLDSVDMMIPNVGYKQTWARETVGVRDYVLPLSFKGFLYGRLWLDLLRPAAKRLYYSLPVVWRERMLRLLG